MKQIYLGMALLCLFATSSFSQETACGTQISAEQHEHLSQYRGMYHSVSHKNSGDAYKVPVKITVLRQDDGTGGLEEKEVYSEMHYLNEYFAESGLQFFLTEEISYLDDDRFYEFKESQEQLMAGGQDRENVINVYFVNSVTMASGSKICGYAYFPKGKDRLVVSSGCTYKATTLAHEMGHYFSLLHTHGIQHNASELANGSNCGQAGDEICDTPADPNLNGMVDQDCEYTGHQVDAEGNPYNPDPTNLMSYANFACRAHFTPEQNQRILFSYLNDRQYLTSQDTFATDFEQLKSKETFVDIYPNPSKGLVNLLVKGHEISDFSLEVYNMTGQVIFHQSFGQEFNSEHFQLDFSGHEKGVYVVSIIANRRYITRKVIYQ